MADKSENTSLEVKAELVKGTVPELVNSPFDVATVLVEGIGGMSVSPHLAKFHFVDHMPIDGKSKARYVVTLAMPIDQLMKLAEALTKAAEAITAAQSQSEAG